MTRERARRIVGNQPRWALRNMARALQLHPWNNSPDEWERLRALRALGFKVSIPEPEYG